MRRLVHLLLVSTMILLGLGATAGAGDAVVPGPNGRIAFARASCAKVCTFTLVAADSRGRHETVLAGPYRQGAFDEHFIVNWSPDGSRAIFMAHQDIWQVNADGTGLHRIFASSGRFGMDDGPTFTPDGKHIIFPRCCRRGEGQGLWRINADGTGLKQLTHEPFTVPKDGPADSVPQVSPDGRRIVFNRCFPTNRPCEIATVGINGKRRHELTRSRNFSTGHPNWSPSSHRIVFTRSTPRGITDIATMRTDGSHLQRVTHSSNRRVFSADACYSPDGTKILFVHGSRSGVDLFTMAPDGSDVARVTSTARADLWPQWATAGP